MTWCGSLASIPRTTKGGLILFAKCFQSLQIDEMILNYRRLDSPRHPFAFCDLILSHGCNLSVNNIDA